MPVTPTGPISLPLHNGADLLANCAAFRTWTGTANAAAARAKAFLVDVDEPPANGREYTAAELTEKRNYATVDEFEHPDGRPGGDAYASRRVGTGAFVDGGKLLVRFLGNVDAAYADNPRDAKVDFLNDIGAILEEVKANGGGDTDLLSVHQIVRWEPYRRASEEEAQTQGDFQTISYVLVWGM